VIGRAATVACQYGACAQGSRRRLHSGTCRIGEVAIGGLVSSPILYHGSCQTVEDPARLADRLIHLRHAVLEIAVTEAPPLDRGERRQWRRWRGDIVPERQDRWPTSPASRLGPVGRSDGLAKRGHPLEPEQPPLRPSRDLDGDAGGDQAHPAVGLHS